MGCLQSFAFWASGCWSKVFPILIWVSSRVVRVPSMGTIYCSGFVASRLEGWGAVKLDSRHLSPNCSSRQ